MKDNISLNKLPDFLGAFSSFIVLGHEEPDGDCLGASLVMARFLESLSSDVYLCSAGPFKRPEIKEWEPSFQRDFPVPADPDKTLCIVLDCSTFGRTGYDKSLFDPYTTLIIDHHAQGSHNEADYYYIDSSSPSTTLLVHRIIELYKDYTLSAELAEILLFGYATDTGFFRHLDAEGGRSLEQVSRLCSSGASPKSVHKKLSVKQSSGTVKLVGRILERIEFHFDGRLVLSWEIPSDREELNTNDRNSSLIYSILSSIEGVEAIALLRDEGDNRCIGGLRSLDKVDVASIASLNGGGGHFNAAGFARDIDLESMKSLILEQFSPSFK